MKCYIVGFSIEGEDDLASLKEYIAAKASLQIAEDYIDKILKEANSLAIAPRRGERRKGLRREFRSIGFKRAVSLLFRIQEKSAYVEIVAVLYRGRRPSEAYRYENPNENFHEL